MTAKKNNNQNQKLHNTCSATKTTKKSTKQHIMDNINAGNKTIESFSMTDLPANVKSKNNKNVKHNASRKKPKLLSTDNNLNKILLTKPMAKDPKLQTRTLKIKLCHKMMTSMTPTCKILLMVSL